MDAEEIRLVFILFPSFMSDQNISSSTIIGEDSLWRASPDLPSCSKAGSAYNDERFPEVVHKGERLQCKLSHNLFVVLPV